MKYKCKRCGFSSTVKSSVQRHTCINSMCGRGYSSQDDSVIGFEIMEIMESSDFSFSEPSYSSSYDSSSSDSD